MIDSENVTNGAKNSSLQEAQEKGNKQIVEPRTWLMWLVLLPIMLLFFGGWFVVNSFFNSYQNSLEKQSVENFGYQPSKLKQMQYETNMTTKYMYEDVATGKMRIPVDKAMDKAINYYERKYNFLNNK